MDLNYEIILSYDAKADIRNVMNWYEDQQKGLGVKFFLSYLNGEKIIKLNPFVSAKIYQDVRRILLKKFSYRVFYTVNEDKKEVDIFAVIHTRRDPKIWQKRVK